MSKEEITVSSGTNIGSVIMIAAWVAGWVLSKGFWLMAASIIFPPYSWYLVLERLMEFYGLIGTL